MSTKTLRRFNYFGLFLSITIFLFSITTNAQSSWNSQDWGFRRAITVSNSTGNILTDFQIKVTLNNSFDFSRCKTDGSDIRFTSDDTQTLIPYWIEEWNPTGTSATIWVKVPTIPASGTTIYLYYDNPSAIFPAPAPPTTVDLPPTGPWTNVAGVTVNGRNGGLLAENMVEENGTYWQLFADRNFCNAQLGLANNITGDPGNASGWNWNGNLIIDFSNRSTNPAFVGDPRLNNTPGNILDPYLDSPHIVKGDDGYWYLFYHWIVGGDPHGSCGVNGTWSWTPGAYAEIGMARAISITGPYIEIDPFILKSSAREGDTDSWDWARVSEPNVFKRDDGKWIMLFMADKGNFDDPGNPNLYYIEQCSYAIADNITGPYTKWHNGSQPFIAFGPSGSLDAGTIADAHPVKFGNTYYIFYAASPSTFGWSTMYLTTTDWENVTKSTSYVYTNESNSPFRGAISKFNNTFYFSYLGSGGSSGGPFMIATQPATGTIPGQSLYGTDAVFDFYDGFDGITLDRSKWNGSETSVDPGYTGTATVSNGELVVTNSGGFISELSAKQLFGIGKMFEARAKHSSTGFAGEIGFGRLESGSAWSGPPYGFKNQRIMDLRVINGSNFVIDADNAEHVESPGDYVVTSTPLDFSNYLVHKVMRVDNNNVKFQLDNFPITTISNTPDRPNRVSSDPLGPWFFVLGGSSMNVDWLRVRGYADPEPTFSIGAEQMLSFTISVIAGSGGSISPSGSVIVNNGGSQSFTISSNAGYHIADVLVDGISVGAVSSYTFNNVIANHTISASFAINTYTLTITSVNGTVTKNPDQANYASGSTVQLTAVPSTGYTFTGWSGDATGSDNPLTVTMNSNKNITADFAVDNNSYIEIGSASALAGSSLTIPVSVHLGGGTSIPRYILQGKIIFDPENLKYRSNSIGSLFTATGWTITGYSTVAGQFDFIATGYNSISSDGILFNLNFDVISNTSGSTQITSQPSYWLSNNSNTPVIFSSIHAGTINITSQSTSAVVGDVDGNFSVDYSDAIAIINHVLNIFTLHGQSLINADVDHNGNITLADAIGVILYCTFGDWNYSLAILSPLTNAYLSVDNPVVNNSGVIIPLNIKNTDNVRSLEVTVDYDPTKFDFDSFTAGINSSNAITKASQVSPGQAKFVFTSNELINNNFSAGSITLKNKNGILAGGSIKTSYKINDGKEVVGTAINTGTTGIENENGNGIPSKFELVQNYPNPFNPTTIIDFRIPITGYYTVKVFNAIGQTVSVLAEKEFSAGNYKVTFDGNNLSSGIYFYQLFGNGVNLIRKMMLIK